MNKWFVRANETARRYCEALERNNPAEEKKGIYGPMIFSLAREIRNAIVCGDLRVHKTVGEGFMPPSEEAYECGFLNLQRFCDWAKLTGRDDCPEDAFSLAFAFGFDEAVKIKNNLLKLWETDRLTDNELSKHGVTKTFINIQTRGLKKMTVDVEPTKPIVKNPKAKRRS